MLDLKNLLRDNYVYFQYYRKGYLYYAINEPIDPNQTMPHSPPRYLFRVPIEDTGEASFGRVDRAILFMRYIRQSQEDGFFVPYNE